MFDQLTDSLEQVFKKLRGHGKLSEKNIEEALREVRRALLESDVNYKVAKDFIEKVKQKATGREVLKSLTPGQQVIKVVHQELVHLMGGDERADIKFAGSPPTAIMLVGLQGSGKTTAAAKLARHFKSKGSYPLLVAADVYRPAAIDQLETLGRSIDVPVYRASEGTDPVDICQDSLRKAKATNRDLIILDTAGRLHIDDEMMRQLERIKAETVPDEILFVADSMTGQDAVAAATEFRERLNFDGVFLTKLDGDARGGAALSIRAVTGAPIKFVGVGEKTDAIEPFYPDRMASRILGMGDILSLVEKAERSIDRDKAQELEEKLKKDAFSLEDFMDQLKQIKNMGPLEELLGLIPGAGKAMKGLKVDEKAFITIEAVINSMTPQERRKPNIIDGRRKKRIAKGSGTTVQDVNRLLKQFGMVQKMAKNMNKANLSWI